LQAAACSSGTLHVGLLPQVLSTACLPRQGVLYSLKRMNSHALHPLDSSVELIKAFADPVRLRLLNLLTGGEVCVCHLHVALGLPQSTVSRHLAYLRRRGLVAGRKEGQWVHYRIAKTSGKLHATLVRNLLACCQDIELLKADLQKLNCGSCC
jgi:ArsR family transcriptional regulator, arsenate/arsenite/antimonite-responsive transcriptional repressor